MRYFLLKHIYVFVWAMVLNSLWVMGKSSHYKDEQAIAAFGNRVRALRMEKNMTIEEFANAHDLHVNQLARIERGLTNVTISYIFLLAELFDLKASELIDFDKEGL